MYIFLELIANYYIRCRIPFLCWFYIKQQITLTTQKYHKINVQCKNLQKAEFSLIKMDIAGTCQITMADPILVLSAFFSQAFQWWQFQYCNAHWSCLVSPGVSAVVYHMALPSSSWGHGSLKIDERSILSRLITLLWKLFSFAVNPPWARLIITDFNSRCSPSWFLNEKGAT